MRVSVCVACVLALAQVVLGTGCAPESQKGASEEVGERANPVQAAFQGQHVALVQDQSLASKATGVLDVPFLDAHGVPRLGPGNRELRGTCGVTFIAPHYAVTAAHCVDSTNVPSPGSASLIVRTFDLSQANPSSLAASSLVTGAFPNYQPATVAASDVPGYQSQVFACSVRARCSYGAYSCTVPADIAMLYCPSRPSAEWLPVAPSDPQQGPVEMYWFHEVLSMPTQAPAPGAPATEADRYNHYTLLTPSANQNNFHYLRAPVNAILPLKSTPWSSGQARTRLGPNGGFTSTDLFGCHGTSGSGVLQTGVGGRLEFLGPVAIGAASWANSRLCADGNTVQPGQTTLSYTNHTFTKQLESSMQRELSLDRGEYRTFEVVPELAMSSFSTTTSAVQVSGVTGNMPAGSLASVYLREVWCAGEDDCFWLDLVAPSGTTYPLDHGYLGGLYKPLYELHVGNEPANGPWTLRVTLGNTIQQMSATELVNWKILLPPP